MKRIDIHERDQLLPEDLDWMLRQARRLTRCSNTAEDLVQETCVEWLRRGPEERGQGPRPWLARVLRNKRALAAKRANAAQARERVAAAAEEIPSHEVEITQAEFRRALMDHVDALPQHQRQAVKYCILEGMSITDAARERGIARTTCGAHLSQGLQTLERQVNGGGPARRWLNSISALLPAWFTRSADQAPRASSAARIAGAGALVVATGAVAIQLLDADRALPGTETIPTIDLAQGSEPPPMSTTPFDLAALETSESRMAGAADPLAASPAGPSSSAAPEPQPPALLKRLLVELDPGSVSQEVLGRLVTLRDSSGREHRVRVDQGEPAEFKNLPFGPAVIMMKPRAALGLEQTVELKEGMDTVVLKWDSMERLEVEVHVEGGPKEGSPLDLSEMDELVSKLFIVAAPGPELRVDPTLMLYSVSKSRWTALEGKWKRSAGEAAAWTQRIQRRKEARYIHVLSGGRNVVATADIPSGRARHVIYLDADVVRGAFGGVEVQLEEGEASHAGATVELLTGSRVHSSAMADASGHASFAGITPGDYLVRATTQEGWKGARACRVTPMADGSPVAVTISPQAVQERRLLLKNVPAKAKRVSVTIAYPVGESGEHMLRRWNLPFMDEGTIEIPSGAEYLSVIAAPQGRESPWIALAERAKVDPASRAPRPETPITLGLQGKLMHQYTGPEIERAFSFRMTPLAADGSPVGPAIAIRTDSRYYLAKNWIAGDYRFQLFTVAGEVCLDERVTLSRESVRPPSTAGANARGQRTGR